MRTLDSFLLIIFLLGLSDSAYSGQKKTKNGKSNVVRFEHIENKDVTKEKLQEVKETRVEDDGPTFWLSTIPTTSSPTIGHIVAGLGYLFFTRGDTIYRWRYNPEFDGVEEPVLYTISPEGRIDHLSVFRQLYLWVSRDPAIENALAFSVGPNLYIFLKTQNEPKLLCKANSNISGIVVFDREIAYSVGNEIFRIQYNPLCPCKDSARLTSANDAIHNLGQINDNFVLYTVGQNQGIYKESPNGSTQRKEGPYPGIIQVIGQPMYLGNNDDCFPIYFSQGNNLYSIDDIGLRTLPRVQEQISGITPLIYRNATDAELRSGYRDSKGPPHNMCILVSAGLGIYRYNHLQVYKPLELVDIAPSVIRFLGSNEFQPPNKSLLLRNRFSYYFSDGFSIFIAPYDDEASFSHLPAVEYILCVPEKDKGEPSLYAVANPIESSEMIRAVVKRFFYIKELFSTVKDIQRLVVLFMLHYFEVLQE